MNLLKIKIDTGIAPSTITLQTNKITKKLAAIVLIFLLSISQLNSLQINATEELPDPSVISVLEEQTQIATPEKVEAEVIEEDEGETLDEQTTEIETSETSEVVILESENEIETANTASIFVDPDNIVVLEDNTSTPVVNTKISVNKTGSEPFDGDTWDGVDLTTAGLDESTSNNVVRLQDSITYKVELSVNDNDVESLNATVILDKKQAWINIPSGCKTDIANPSTISTDGRTLFCNTGPAIEGTTKLIFPPARVIGASFDGTEITLNDDRVNASVTAQADTSLPATDTSEDTIVTADFKVDTTKELKVTALDPLTNEPLYVAPYKAGPLGEDGSLMEYTIKTTYRNGSMLIDSDESSYEIDIDFLDIITDDNTANDAIGGFSSNAQLYTWDSNNPACSLIGDHGNNANVTCTQNDLPLDLTGPAGSADTFFDRNIDIDLNSIDVRDPDLDNNVVELRLNVWIPKVEDIDTHQSCAFGVCTNIIINEVGVNNGGVLEGYNPTSTEDAGNNNLLNYNGAGEPLRNTIDYPLIYTTPGTFSAHVSWKGLFPHATDKAPDQETPSGATIPFLLNHFDYRKIDGAFSYVCAKFDTTSYTYAGLAAPNQTGLDYGFNTLAAENPNYVVFGGAGGTIQDNVPGDLLTILYSIEPNDTFAEQRDDTCDDDVDGVDGANIMDENGVQSGAGAVDWYTNLSDVPGGAAAVTKVRQKAIYDAAFTNAIDNTHTQTSFAVNHLVTVNPGAGYGTNNYIPLHMSFQTEDGAGNFSTWNSGSAVSTDPENAGFSLAPNYADRMTVVPSGHSIEKYTDPRGIKVVRGGDIIDFIVEPKIFGLWDSSINTARVTDNLPAQTSYVGGSERFSLDNGATWMTREQYDNSSPAITQTRAAHTSGADPLDWRFGSVDSGEQLPLIKYSVEVDANQTSGTFTNVARILSDIGIDGDNDGSGDTLSARYELTVLPEFGFDVLKLVAPEVYNTNEAFTFDLVYKNLGGEAYTNGSFIDILPYNGDAAGSIGGLASNRDPATAYNGIVALTNISSAEGESFFVTDRDPSLISMDPCVASNLPNGYVPVLGDLCYANYLNTGALPDGATQGDGTTVWTACTNSNNIDVAADCTLDPYEISAVRFDVTSIGTAGGQTVSLTINPIGNVGGDVEYYINGDGVQKVDYDNSPNVGDVYTNNFGGRIAEISLNVLSNDVTTTPVDGSVGDYVWFDANNDGLQVGELGAENVNVALLDSAGNPVYTDPNTGAVILSADRADYEAVTGVTLDEYTTTTDANGLYTFDQLPSGSFQVQLTDLNTNYTQTYELEEGYTDANGVGATTPYITSVIVSAETDPGTGNITDIQDVDTADFGLYADGSIGDYVWFDLNGDGVQDTNEPPIQGAEVVLTDSNGDPVYIDSVNGGVIDATDPNAIPYVVITDANGAYLFEGLPVDLLDPAADTDYTVTVNTPFTQVSDPDGTLDNTSTTGISANENEDLDQDFGYQPNGTIGDTLWWDLDQDGVIDTDETFIEGAVVNLYVEDPANPGNYIPYQIEDPLNPGTFIDYSLTTGADGQYLFESLLSGNYEVQVDPASLPTDAIQTYDFDSTLDNTSQTSLIFEFDGDGLITGVSSDLDQDFGYYLEGSVGDYVWYDLNGDGVQDPNEPPIEGATLSLTYDDGSPVYIDSVNGGVVDASDPNAIPYTTTTASDGSYLFDGLPIDEDYVVVSGTTLDQTYDQDGVLDNMSIASLDQSNQDDEAQDFGYIPDGTISGTIWKDLDNDGAQNGDENLFEGVTVTLVDPITGDPILDGDGNPITTVTDENGDYIFEQLPPGDYQVVVDVTTLPEDLTQVFDVDGTLDNGTIVTLVIETDPDGNITGVSDEVDQDFGYLNGSIGDYVWYDQNEDGDFDDDGTEFAIEGVVVDLYLDTNNNGIADPSEYITSATTDADGAYLFDELLLEDNPYLVVIDETQDALINTVHSTGTVGVNNNSQDNEGYAITLTPAEPDDMTGDFGFTFYGPFDPPSARKTVSEAGEDVIEWQQVWINQTNRFTIFAQITDTIPEGTTYVDGSFTCDARGNSITTRCEYVASENRTIWEGYIGGDLDNFTEDTASNEIVLRFQTLLDDNTTFVDNQAELIYDTDNDGILDSEVVVSNDPSTGAELDPTQYTREVEANGPISLIRSGGNYIALIPLMLLILTITIIRASLLTLNKQ